MRTSCMERRIWIKKKNELTHKKTHTNMGAERGRNRCCGTDMHTHSHFSVLTHSLNIRFVWAKPSMAQRHPNLKTQIFHSLYLHRLSFKLLNHNPQAQTAAPSSHSSLSHPLVSLFLFVLPSLLNLLGRSLSPSSPLVLPGWADDWVPLTAPENPTRGHQSRTSQVRVSGKERGTMRHGKPSDRHCVSAVVSSFSPPLSIIRHPIAIYWDRILKSNTT